MASNRSNRTLPSITARPSPEIKARFAELAAQRGVSESALALVAIRALLDSSRGTTPISLPVRQGPSTDRITIRLRPGDARAIHDRASCRGMRPSTYLAGLVRSHIATNPPLPSNELGALKQAVTILATVGRLLAHISRSGVQGGDPAGDLRGLLSQTRAVVAALEKRTHDLARAALVAWESRYD